MFAGATDAAVNEATAVAEAAVFFNNICRVPGMGIKPEVLRPLPTSSLLRWPATPSPPLPQVTLYCVHPQISHTVGV